MSQSTMFQSYVIKISYILKKISYLTTIKSLHVNIDIYTTILDISNAG